MYTYIAHAWDTITIVKKNKKKLARILGCFASESLPPFASSFADEPPSPSLSMRIRLSRHPSFTPKRNNMDKNNSRGSDARHLRAPRCHSSVCLFVYLFACLSVNLSVLSPAYTRTLSLTLYCPFLFRVVFLFMRIFPPTCVERGAWRGPWWN